MASTSETGYAKQFAEYEDFVKRIATLGSAYNPPKAALYLSNLQDKVTAGKNAMRAISAAIPVYSKAVDDQTLAFKPLNDRITKSLNYYKACLSNPAEVDTAKNLADKMRGIQKSKAPAKADAQPVQSISQSQKSYDSLIENFKQYIDVLKTSGVYQNAGPGISISDLELLLQQIEQSNNSVIDNKFPLDAARKERDIIFYAPKTGIADLILDAKNYIKATLSKDNPHYKPLISFGFRKLS